MHVLKKMIRYIVISGKDKGKKGTVIEILPKKGKVMVKGIAVVTTHVKAVNRVKFGIKKEESLYRCLKGYAGMFCM